MLGYCCPLHRLGSGHKVSVCSTCQNLQYIFSKYSGHLFWQIFSCNCFHGKVPLSARDYKLYTLCMFSILTLLYSHTCNCVSVLLNLTALGHYLNFNPATNALAIGIYYYYKDLHLCFKEIYFYFCEVNPNNDAAILDYVPTTTHYYVFLSSVQLLCTRKIRNSSCRWAGGYWSFYPYKFPCAQKSFG